MTDQNAVIGLVNDLESFNAYQVRSEALKKIMGLDYWPEHVVAALHKLTSDIHPILAEMAQDAVRFYQAGGQTPSQTPRINKKHKRMLTEVKVTVSPGSDLEVENASSFCKCNFCGKEMLITSATRRFTEKMSGSGRFYCIFCLRHGFNHRSSRNILMLTFRGIIGYYYLAFYSQARGVQMHLSEINDYINLHVQAGLQNPLFVYDQETYVWFIDFSSVGESGKKQPIQDVLFTVMEIILSFGLLENVKDIKPHKLYFKYEEAILKFYHQRSRPNGAKILAPTLYKTDASDYATEKLSKDAYSYSNNVVTDKRRINFEETRCFMPGVLLEASGKKY